MSCNISVYLSFIYLFICLPIPRPSYQVCGILYAYIPTCKRLFIFLSIYFTNQTTKLYKIKAVLNNTNNIIHIYYLSICPPIYLYLTISLINSCYVYPNLQKYLTQSPIIIYNMKGIEVTLSIYLFMSLTIR